MGPPSGQCCCKSSMMSTLAVHCCTSLAVAAGRQHHGRPCGIFSSANYNTRAPAPITLLRVRNPGWYVFKSTPQSDQSSSRTEPILLFRQRRREQDRQPCADKAITGDASTLSKPTKVRMSAPRTPLANSAFVSRSDNRLPSYPPRRHLEGPRCRLLPEAATTLRQEHSTMILPPRCSHWYPVAFASSTRLLRHLRTAAATASALLGERWVHHPLVLGVGSCVAWTLLYLLRRDTAFWIELRILDGYQWPYDSYCLTCLTTWLYLFGKWLVLLTIVDSIPHTCVLRYQEQAQWTSPTRVAPCSAGLALLLLQLESRVVMPMPSIGAHPHRLAEHDFKWHTHFKLFS